MKPHVGEVPSLSQGLGPLFGLSAAILRLGPRSLCGQDAGATGGFKSVVTATETWKDGELRWFKQQTPMKTHATWMRTHEKLAFTGKHDDTL